MKTIRRISILATAIYMLSSCNKEATGPSSIQFQMKATNPSGTLAARTNAATIEWKAGTATPSLVKFEAKQGTIEVEYSSTAAQQVNLFTITRSTFGNIILPEGTYTEIELKIQLNGSASAPAMELNGNYNNGTGDVPVAFRVTTPLLVKAEKNNVLITGGAFTAVTELNLSLYTTGITQTMMNAATRTAGTIVISSTSNANLYNIIVNNIDRFHHADINHD